MAVNFQKSISDPPAVDIGNKTTQGRNVPKTIQLSSFTTNKNAVWASNIQLMKNCYPFAVIAFPANRNAFRYQVGDTFLLKYAKYSIVGMVCRVLAIQEKNIKSEDIVVHCIQDFYSVVTPVSDYTAPINNQTPEPDYTVEDLVNVDIWEAPYVMTTSVAVVPMVCRNSDLMVGFNLHLSIDAGGSYAFLADSLNVVPFGHLNAEYGLSYSIDMGATGFVVDFVDDQEYLETVGMANALSGNSNLVLVGDELMSFTTVTPITETQYRFTGIIRSRYGTEQVVHPASSTEVWFVGKSLAMVTHSEIAVGADRRFKFVAYNSKLTGEIATAPFEDLSITGLAKTPYKPTNFVANGVSFASRYTSGGDIVTGWTPRKRGEGAGIGIPGEVLAGTDREGYFRIEVWVSSVKVRDTIDTAPIDGKAWTYTNAMNVNDNGTPADEIEFRLVNYLEESGFTYTSPQNIITCKKSL